MKENSEAVRVGVYLNSDLIQKCDATMEKLGIESRSAFIRDSIEHYIAATNMQDSSKVLTPALESVIHSRISMTEDRLSRMLFKLGVEVAMMNNILAATHNINTETMDDLRAMCVNIVASIGGRYKLEDAIAFQKGD